MGMCLENTIYTYLGYSNGTLIGPCKQGVVPKIASDLKPRSCDSSLGLTKPWDRNHMYLCCYTSQSSCTTGAFEKGSHTEATESRQRTRVSCLASVTQELNMIELLLHEGGPQSMLSHVLHDKVFGKCFSRHSDSSQRPAVGSKWTPVAMRVSGAP